VTNKKIALLLASPPQYSETFLNSKIKGLQEKGFEVTVFSGTPDTTKYTFTHINHYPAAGIVSLIYMPAALFRIITKGLKPSLKFYRLERSNGSTILNTLKKIYLNAQILSRRFDWIHFGFAALAVEKEFVAAAINAKMGISFRGYDISLYPLKNPGCYNKLWKTVDQVHSISEALYKKALLLGLPPSVPYKKITPALDPELFPFHEDAIVMNQPLQLLTVGRLIWKKGYTYAFLAIRKLLDKGISLHYTIAGTGEQFEEITFALSQLNLQDHVTLSGKLKHEEVIALYGKANIYLQPSVQEGFCNSVQEAQASGLLCIVSDAEGLPENVLDQKTGWVVKRRDAGMLAEKIEEVMNMPRERLHEITGAARKRMEDEFNIASQQARFAQFFNS
jgi:colanic acid/amylovoran biosynthesis glycosyltransferase